MYQVRWGGEYYFKRLIVYSRSVSIDEAGRIYYKWLFGDLYRAIASIPGGAGDITIHMY